MERTALVGEVEARLAELYPGQWIQLAADEVKALGQRQFVLAWRVNIPARSLAHAAVDHLVVAIDRWFPNSQPRIFAPSAGADYQWPHVEPNGLLCLRSSQREASAAARIAFHLEDANVLLNFSEDRRRQEFEREFVAYWSHRSTRQSARPRVVSLVTPSGGAREVCYFFDPKSDWHVIADDKQALRRWLRNAGVNAGDKLIFPTWLFRLSQPWITAEFPTVGSDVTKLLPAELAQRFLTPGARPPFLFEVETDTGSAFAAVVLQGAERRQLERGFRHISKVPADRIVNSYAMRNVERCRVSRADGAWVHGRGHSSSYAELRNRKVVVVGCGAIGSAVARLLAQAGVGELAFVDSDDLSSANVSRHLLGLPHIGFNKAFLLQTELARQFPHLTFDHAFPRRFENLETKDLEHLAEADLIISAGIDVDGEAALDAWRRRLARPSAYLSTWVEAYGVAGHAVLLFGAQSIMSAFDADERPVFRLTDWPAESAAMIVEAGCGNSFQPHGVVDLHPTVGLAAELALDTLLDRVPASCRRVWMGDPTGVEAKGGILRAAFDSTRAIREFPWS